MKTFYSIDQLIEQSLKLQGKRPNGLVANAEDVAEARGLIPAFVELLKHDFAIAIDSGEMRNESDACLCSGSLCIPAAYFVPIAKLFALFSSDTFCSERIPQLIVEAQEAKRRLRRMQDVSNTAHEQMVCYF